MAGLAVTLLGGGADGLISTAADNTTVTVVTDANGNYRFTGLTPGVQYQVQFTKPADHIYTGRDIGTDTGDSDADTATGRSQVLVARLGREQHDARRRHLRAGQPGQPRLARRQRQRPPGRGRGGHRRRQGQAHRRRRRRRHQRQRRHQGRRHHRRQRQLPLHRPEPRRRVPGRVHARPDGASSPAATWATTPPTPTPTRRPAAARSSASPRASVNRSRRRGRLLQRQPGRQGLARPQRQRPPGRGRGRASRT